MTYTELLKKTVQQFLIITIVFILAGTILNTWSLWVLYLIPSIVLFTQSKDTDSRLAKIYHSFFIVTSAYLAIGMFLDIWHPTWLMYLLPLIFYLNKKK